MGDLTKNISRYEIACKCGCGFDTIDYETVKVVQECCDHFAKRLGKDRVVLYITSGCRCPEYNERIGGRKNSQHTKGRAIDFVIRGVLPADVQLYLMGKYKGKYGIGQYDNFTHFDTRSREARWKA